MLDLFSKAGLSMDHHQFDEAILEKGTQAILKTRDGLLRAAVPNPIGSCVFLNDVTNDELCTALRKHKDIMTDYPRNGEGLDAFVDASDTGYTMNPHEKVETNKKADSGLLKKIEVLNEKSTANGANGSANGANGRTNGHTNVHTNGVNGVDKLHSKTNGATTNGTNGTNSVNGHSVTNGVAHDRH